MDKQKFISSYKVWKFGHRIDGTFTSVIIADNKLEASKQRLVRKVLEHYKKFDYWATLTFAERPGRYNVEGYNFTCEYDIHDAKSFEKWAIAKKTNKGRIAGQRYLVSKGFSGWIRQFINRVQTYSRKYLDGSMSYFWIYEQGSKGNRPHFHCCLSDIGKDIDEMKDFLMSKWNCGHIDIEYLEQDVRKLENYIGAYFNKEKTFKFDQFTGTRFWNTSRDIPRIPSNPDVQFLGFGNTHEQSEYLPQIVSHDPENAKFKIDYEKLTSLVIETPELKERLKFLNTYFEVFPWETAYEYIDSSGKIKSPIFLYLNKELFEK